MHSENIIKSALLGTDKYMSDIPTVLTEWDNGLQKIKEDKEDYFLKLAAGILLFDELGTDPAKVEAKSDVCPDETKKYISARAGLLFKQLLQTKEEHLFDYFIIECRQQGKVVTPEFVPQLLDKAFADKNKESSLILAEVCGETGKWLAKQNESWNKLAVAEDADVWETGSLVQRKNYLEQLRQQDPRAAIPLLEKSIAEETAANRQVFLEVLSSGLSLEDEPFLTSFINDRSKGVKQAVCNLLKSLRGSALYLSYMDFLKKILSVQEQRAFLIVKKKALVISKDFTPDKELFESGIGKISSQKGVEDSDFWVSELIRSIHPEDLAEVLGTSVEETLELFLDHPQKKLFILSLIQTVNTHKYTGWINSLISLKDGEGISLMRLMNVPERIKHMEKVLDDEVHFVIQLICDLDHNEQLPLSFAEKLLIRFKKDPYTIFQNTYTSLAIYLPASVCGVLERYSDNKNDQAADRYLATQAAAMLRIVEIREKIKEYLSNN